MSLRLSYLVFWQVLGLVLLMGRASSGKDVELLVLRHEVAVLLRTNPLPRLDWADRAVFAALVARALGTRLHPLTGAWASYFLCSYLAGEATNGDVVENSAVTWVPVADIGSFIPVEHIFEPVRARGCLDLRGS